MNNQDNDGNTALILAAKQSDNAVMIELLLAYGADRLIKNRASRTAHMEAKGAQHKAICPLLKPDVSYQPHAFFQVPSSYLVPQDLNQKPSAPPFNL